MDDGVKEGAGGGAKMGDVGIMGDGGGEVYSDEFMGEILVE